MNTLIVIRLTIDELRRHVIGCADVCIRKRGVCHGFRQAEVAQLDHVVFVEEDVLRLDVTMENDLLRSTVLICFGMAVGECSGYLG